MACLCDLPAVQDSPHTLQERPEAIPGFPEAPWGLRTRWPPGVGNDDLVAAPVQHRRDGGGPALPVFRLHGDGGADEFGGQRGRVAVVDGPPVTGGQSVRPPSRARIGAGRGGIRVRGEVEQCPVLVALEEAGESLHEPVVLGGVGLADAVDVGADQDQAAGAALAVGGGEAGLGAADLAGEGVALSAFGLLERLFLRREFSLDGRLPRQQLLKFFLSVHPGRR